MLIIVECESKNEAAILFSTHHFTYLPITIEAIAMTLSSCRQAVGLKPSYTNRGQATDIRYIGPAAFLACRCVKVDD